jgi:hypothetical protein
MHRFRKPAGRETGSEVRSFLLPPIILDSGKMPERLIGTRWKRDGRSNAAPEFESQFFRQFFLVCGAIGSAAVSKTEG